MPRCQHGTWVGHQFPGTPFAVLQTELYRLALVSSLHDVTKLTLMYSLLHAANVSAKSFVRKDSGLCYFRCRRGRGAQHIAQKLTYSFRAFSEGGAGSLDGNKGKFSLVEPFSCWLLACHDFTHGKNRGAKNPGGTLRQILYFMQRWQNLAARIFRVTK